jgi:hypothetical protein
MQKKLINHQNGVVFSPFEIRNFYCFFNFCPIKKINQNFEHLENLVAIKSWPHFKNQNQKSKQEKSGTLKLKKKYRMGTRLNVFQTFEKNFFASGVDGHFFKIYR